MNQKAITMDVIDKLFCTADTTPGEESIGSSASRTGDIFTTMSRDIINLCNSSYE